MMGLIKCIGAWLRRELSILFNTNNKQRDNKAQLAYKYRYYSQEKRLEESRVLMRDYIDTMEVTLGIINLNRADNASDEDFIVKMLSGRIPTLRDTIAGLFDLLMIEARSPEQILKKYTESCYLMIPKMVALEEKLHPHGFEDVPCSTLNETFRNSIIQLTHELHAPWSY